MSDTGRKFFSGNTLQQAILSAAAHYDIDPEQVAYRQVEKRHGFLKTRRRVLISVDPQAPTAPAEAAASPEPQAAREKAPPRRKTPPRRPAPAPEPEAEEAAAPEPEPEEAAQAEREEAAQAAPERAAEPETRRRSSRRGRGRRGRDAGDAGGAGDLVELPEQPRRLADRYQPATGPLADAARQGLEVIAEAAGLRYEAEVLEGEDRLEIDLSGPHRDLLVAEDGELLLAIEHLLPRVMRGFCGDSSAVRVDCENFHEIREERLRSYAQQTAGDVRKSGRPQTLDPLSPSDRRIVHLTITHEPGVRSRSEGDGFLKRVRVEPE